jgi:uncharacterized SAM-binding protein YcdF (DUF218 family)
MKCPLRHRWLVLIPLGVLLVVFLWNRQILPLLARWLDAVGPPQKGDAGVLLTGGLNTRPFVAAALLHGGWAPKILLNSVAAHPNQARGTIPPSDEIISKVLAYGGVPPDCVVCLDSKVETTFDEAKAVAKYLAGHPTQRLIIVTDGPHTRRARWIFERALDRQAVEIEMVSAPVDEFDNENWWRSEEGFLFVVSEYFKLFFYGLRYGWLGYEILVVMAVLIFLGTWFSRRRKLIQNRVV